MPRDGDVSEARQLLQLERVFSDDFRRFSPYGCGKRARDYSSAAIHFCAIYSEAQDARRLSSGALSGSSAAINSSINSSHRDGILYEIFVPLSACRSARGRMSVESMNKIFRCLATAP